MNSHNRKTSAFGSNDAWKLRLFRTSCLAATVVGMIGWLIALSWLGLSVLRLFVQLAQIRSGQGEPKYGSG